VSDLNFPVWFYDNFQIYQELSDAKPVSNPKIINKEFLDLSKTVVIKIFVDIQHSACPFYTLYK